jgi:hypothetical protein
MAHNSPSPQWQKGDLWDTDPNTFLAREAVKRDNLTEAYLTDDAIMKLLVNKREKTIKGTVISRFNEAEFAKGAILRSKHKGRGAPALAPDGTVMTVVAGTQHNTVIQLNGGNRNLPVGNWSVENYQAMSDHPGYNAWLTGIKRTTGDALRAGIPLTSINATLTGPPRGWQQKSFEPEEHANDLPNKSASPELIDPKLIDPRLTDPALTNLANKGQHNLTNDFTKPPTNKAQERTTTTHPVTPQKPPSEDVPSEYATLPSNHSEITTSPGSSLSGTDHSETSGLERVGFDRVASISAASELAPLVFASSKSTTPDPVMSEPATSEAIIPKLVSSPAAFEPASPPVTTSEPVAPELTASEPTPFQSQEHQIQLLPSPKIQGPPLQNHQSQVSRLRSLQAQALQFRSLPLQILLLSSPLLRNPQLQNPLSLSLLARSPLPPSPQLQSLLLILSLLP